MKIQEDNLNRARAYIESLEANFRKLIEGAPIKVGGPLPDNAPQSAVYLFSGEGDEALYVGRTDRLKDRLNYHHRSGSDTNAASFAFLLAREATGMMTHKRAACLSDRKFLDQFSKARILIRQMDLRYFGEPDPIGQALLEIFIATATGAKHNSFKNH